MEYQLIGNNRSINKIRELIGIVSDTALSVLILGETGTGKEVVARLLHQASPRRGKPFVKVNCAALPLTLLESELFGYEKGAFTGADKLKLGKFELASQGAIFLDEIGDMPMVLQAKLLQVLQSSDFTRLGGTEDIKVNTWIISSTNQDLQGNIGRGLFREDLYYRLNIIKVELPPLRERKEDIPLLIHHFVEKYRRIYNLDGEFRLNRELDQLFQNYHWPGNVRELASSILNLMIGVSPKKVITELRENMRADGHELMKVDQTIESDSLLGDDTSLETPLSFKDVKTRASDYIERKAILHALNKTGWNKVNAAKLLKISYKALWYKIENLGIEKA